MSKAMSQTEILGQMIELLTPLSSEDRQRIVKSTMTFLGETSSTTKVVTNAAGGDEDDAPISVRARNWLKQNGLAVAQLEQVFSLSEGNAEVIASSIPGASAKERTVNAYVLAGVSNYLMSGDSKFDDKLGRSVCSNSGCYDNTNHATYLKAKGNLFTGTKDTGWALTTPGLKHGAGLIKTLAEQ